MMRVDTVNAARLASIFKVLSVDKRVRIVRLRKRRSYCVTELTTPPGITQAATSQHLRVLRDAGIVRRQKRGLQVYYHLDRENVAQLSKEIDQLLR
ncbi:MAG: ArsR/SmtB family transcription factor [Planctomycetota bacterium]|jgi:ArsR family transcriptional regulator